MDALAREPEARPPTAREFRQQLRNAVPGATNIEAGDLAALLWGVVGDRLDDRASRLPPGSAKTRQSIQLEQQPEDMVARLTAPVGHAFEDASTVPSTFVPPKIDSAPQPTPEYYYPEHTPPPPVSGPGDDLAVPLERPSQTDDFGRPMPQPAPPSDGSGSLILVAIVGLLAGAVIVLAALLFFG